ncbi:MAG: hypothetical protein K0R52_1242 [Alphaproteobacteria bacterium]|nr:hypothetical protein [Alphaproteobacteria bacterium]
MNNRRVVKKNWDGPFEEAEQYGPTVAEEELHFHPRPANGPSFLREEAPSTASMPYDPPPSFLTQAPLGTSCEEAVDLKRWAEISGIGKQDGTVDTVPLARKAFEQPRQIPKKLKKRPYGRDEGNGFIHRWVYEEVRLSMSKMSIMSLVLGLLFLGTLFFIIGFLAAVATLKQDDAGHARSAWQASNTQAQGGQGGRKLGAMVGSAGSSLVGNEVHKQLAPLGKVMGTASAAVPRPLQPFARYGVGSAQTEVRSVGKQVNPFMPYRRIGASEQQTYGGVQQQPSGAPQGYPASQGQPYGFPATPAGYPQPVANLQGEQGGYGQGYVPEQPPPMMMPQPMLQQGGQQSSYPQPMQQPMGAPYPQMMGPQPQMVPQQQQMMAQQPYPPHAYYPQQMMPQGHYR